MNKNPFLAPLLILSIITLSCQYDTLPQARQTEASGRANEQIGSKQNTYEAPIIVGWLEDQSISESSGIVVSRRAPNLFWTHNDSGNGPFLYAFNEQGKRRGVWRVSSAEAIDWEDIAAGPGPQPGKSYLYVGDIGDNRMTRHQITVYRVPEPEVLPTDDKSSRKSASVTEQSEPIRIQYPDGQHDAEALLVHPVTGDIYIITKALTTAANVYKLAAPYSTSAVNKLTLLGMVRGVPTGFITGGDIAPDGNSIVLCDYLAAYELRRPVGDSAFDDIWRQTANNINLSVRQQGESVGYGADSDAIYATSEKRPTPLIKVKRVKKPN